MIDPVARDAMIHAARFLERTELALLMLEMLDDPRPVHPRTLVVRIWTRIHDLAEASLSAALDEWESGTKGTAESRAAYDRVRKTRQRYQHALDRLRAAQDAEELAAARALTVRP